MRRNNSTVKPTGAQLVPASEVFHWKCENVKIKTIRPHKITGCSFPLCLVFVCPFLTFLFCPGFLCFFDVNTSVIRSSMEYHLNTFSNNILFQTEIRTKQLHVVCAKRQRKHQVCAANLVSQLGSKEKSPCRGK
ncbi:hypothetical protein PoB_001515400 [Plakobranchus ocellatus]|uniref:Uncharacterized protein n=1 Tax=Plakobranchus ocellatus TaxID=259542 RepID=A0AAV3Z018_9GAST|nr:hypothetical protein PoB_001515400 [Plakobranchus ocellatus]